MHRRENTFRIDYASIPKKPSYEELHHFVGTVLGMQREEVLRLQCSKYLGCAFVKASSLAVAERIVNEHDGKHDMEVDKKKYPIRMWMEDGGVDVKLHDLSEDVRDENISAFMLQYGEILSIRELTWDSKYTFGDIPTGIRVVRMVVKKNIPSIITVDGETTCVSYFGQMHTCRHCNEPVHNGVTCIQNKKLLLQKLQADKVSYANVTKHGESTEPAEKSTGGTSRRATTNTASDLTTNKRSTSASSTASTSKAKPTHLKQSEPMPPPSLPVPTTSSTRADMEFPSLSKPPTRAAAIVNSQQRNDEHESDSSTSSNSGRRLRDRPPGKKMRHDNIDNNNTQI